LRGVEAELQGGLEGGLSEVSEECADLLFAVIDEVPGLSLVDGGRYLGAERLEDALEVVAKGRGGDSWLRGHDGLREEKVRGIRQSHRCSPIQV
jgi:hypothetical protein